jgi:SAM-dependent methyltransferase
MINAVRRYFDNQHERDDWVKAQVAALPAGAMLLDAGAGSQKYRPYCSHLQYRAQDFGGVTVDAQEGYAGLTEAYKYGALDYTGNIWDIEEESGTFDAILCTEVFEHIPYPNDALREFSRLLRPGGTLILTAPFASIRHMDPYFFYSGFSDRWYEKLLPDCGFSAKEIIPSGNYHRSIAVELFRTLRIGSPLGLLWRGPLLLPALAYYFIRSMRPTSQSISSLVSGYFILAEKNGGQ